MASSLPVSGLAAALPRLTQETELQKMLADEKMRSEQHKTNYQTLKAEHTRLQDEFISVQTELKSTIEESRLVGEKYKTLVDQARKDLACKMAEVDELKSQTLTSHRLDMIKVEVQEELEKPFRQKFQSMEEQVERYRNEYNKLKYEHSFLKAEYEHEKCEHARVVEETTLRHEAEVSNLRKERELVITRQMSENSGDSQRVRVLQRENAQCHLKMKGLLSELEEIRAQREHLGLQSDSVTRLQSKQLGEHATNVKALETERESLKLQCINLQRELTVSSHAHDEQTAKVHDLEKENIMLKNKSEEVTHKSKVEITNLKMDMLKERGDLERERDKLYNDIDDLKNQIEICKHSMAQQSSSLAEKERESVKRVQAAREEEWQKLHAIENHKLELETKLQEMERRKIDDESQRYAERDKIDERIRQAHDAKESAEKEALVYKTKVTHQESLVGQLERERSENSDLKTRLHRIETQYQTYVSSEQEFIDTNERLKNQLEQYRDDLRIAREEASRFKSENDNTLIQHRTQWADEKTNLQKRVDELELQLTDMHSKMSNIITSQKKKKKKMAALISKLKDKVTLQKAKLEEYHIANEALKKSVPSNVHVQLKKQLRDLVRRHQEFRTVMLASGQVNQVAIGDLSFASVGIPADQVGSNLNFLDAHGQHEKDLAQLKERLDMLDDNQQHQMEELRQVSPIGTPRKKPSYVKSSCSLDSDYTDRDSDKELDHVEAE